MYKSQRKIFALLHAAHHLSSALSTCLLSDSRPPLEHEVRSNPTEGIRHIFRVIRSIEQTIPYSKEGIRLWSGGRRVATLTGTTIPGNSRHTLHYVRQNISVGSDHLEFWIWRSPQLDRGSIDVKETTNRQRRHQGQIWRPARRVSEGSPCWHEGGREERLRG